MFSRDHRGKDGGVLWGQVGRRWPREALAHAGGGPLRQITYSATSDELRNKQLFPALLRTVPGADHQIEAMVQLMLHFRWNWIIVLVSSDDYGRYNSQLLNERLATRDICIAFQETLPMPQPNLEVTQWEHQRLEAIVDKLQQSSARVVVLFSPDLVLHNFFREVLRQNFTGAVWIASESWSIDPVLHNLTELRNTGTFLGITTQSVPIPGFSEFRMRPAQAGPPEPNRTSLGATCNQECDTCQDTAASFNTILTLSGERVVYSVYSAVYAVAHALHSLLSCTQTACSKRVVYPWQVRPRPRKVRAPRSGVEWLPWRPPGARALCWPSRLLLGSGQTGGRGHGTMPCLQTHRTRQKSFMVTKLLFVLM